MGIHGLIEAKKNYFRKTGAIRNYFDTYIYGDIHHISSIMGSNGGKISNELKKYLLSELQIQIMAKRPVNVHVFLA